MELRDGTPIRIRPVRPEDEPVLVDLFRRLSPESVYQRFLAPLSQLSPDMAHHLASVDDSKRMALIAESGSQVIAVARYECTEDPSVVELALVVADEWQNRGLGRILLREIVATAERHGINRFRADVLAENRRMLQLLTTEGEIYDRRTEAGVATLLFRPRIASKH
jgi:GNAT superfamily N-acetyltransferase